MAVRLSPAAALAASAALHALLALALARVPPPPPRRETVPIDLVESVRAAPPPLPRAPEPAAPPRRNIAARPLPREAPPSPSPGPQPPPPPSAPPPENAPPPAKAPIHIGLSMSSTTTAGSLAAPVGNTMYGEMPRTAPRPEDVAPYRSERYVPPTQVTVLPRLIGGPPRVPREEYPPEALKLGIERRVVAMVTVDETGKVTQVRVLDDPGYGFREAAERIVRKYYRFEPARRGEEPVATTLRIPVAFEISGD